MHSSHGNKRGRRWITQVEGRDLAPKGWMVRVEKAKGAERRVESREGKRVGEERRETQTDREREEEGEERRDERGTRERKGPGAAAAVRDRKRPWTVRTED